MGDSTTELRATIEEQRIIGGLMARLDSIEKTQETARKENKDGHQLLFVKLDALALLVPTVERHEKDIEKLKDRPGRIIEVGAALVAAIAAVLAWKSRFLNSVLLRF